MARDWTQEELPPPTDDLRARLQFVADAIKPIKGLQGMDATVREAIAALSALPAAGRMVAEIMEASERDGAYLTHCNVRLRVYNGYVPAVGDSIYTTPQPSAAEGETNGFITTVPDKSDRIIWRGHYYHLRPGMTAPTDAAVGAQGEAEELARWLDAKYSRHREDEDRRAAALIRRLAAPAAGKGVDDAALGRAYRRWYGAAKGYKDVDADAAHDFITREAALTRQPVAGDGMVLVPREPTPWMRVHGRECQAKRDLMEAVCERKWWPYDCGEADDLVAGIYRAMIAAAPAATPTDGEAASA